MASLSLKLYDKIYAGFRSQSEENPLPFCYITESGTDSYAKKRMKRVDDWMRHSDMETVTLDNTPISGFRFNESTYEYASHNVCRIEDPRGFETEITMKNMARILLTSMVVDGEIMSKCVWAKDGAVDVLVSTSSPEYQQALTNTERFNSKVNMRTVKPGFKIERRDGYLGTFYGSMWGLEYSAVTQYDEDDSNARWRRRDTGLTETISFKFAERKEYVTFMHAPNETVANEYMDTSKVLKVSNVLDGTIMEKADAEAYVNKKMIANNKRWSTDSTVCYFFEADADVEIELVPTSINAIQQMNRRDLQWSNKRFAARLADGREMLFYGVGVFDLGQVNRPTGFMYVRNPGNFNIYGQAVSLAEVQTGTFKLRRDSYYNDEGDKQIYGVLESEITEVFEMQVKVTNKAGVTYTFPF